MLPFFIGAWLTISTVLTSDLVEWQPSLQSGIILIEFNETSGGNHPSMTDINNYTIVDSEGKIYRKDAIARIIKITDDAGEIIPSYSTIIALKCERLKYKTSYAILVQGIRNRSGELQQPDTSYYYFNGYAPNLINTPDATLR